MLTVEEWCPGCQAFIYNNLTNDCVDTFVHGKMCPTNTVLFSILPRHFINESLPDFTALTKFVSAASLFNCPLDVYL